ncbi:MAG: DinB family protein [Chloroflexi bacterium]|nr:DinB family protein [Chloroflexota bacterium]MDA1146999.1 DinB family protein [Chloroflexota bacterium]
MTSPEQQAEFDRMRGYYLKQGERYSFSELWPRAVQARLELLDSLAGISDAEAAWSPSAEDWSIKEVALHVINGSRNTRRVVQALSAGDTADSSNIDPPRKTTEATMDQLRDQLREDGIDWAAATQELPPKPALEPTAPHSMFGELHARAWYLFQRTHDLDHKGQIEAVKAAAGYPGASA